MRKRRGVFTFTLSMIVLLVFGRAIYAAELGEGVEDTVPVQGEEVQGIEAPEEDDIEDSLGEEEPTEEEEMTGEEVPDTGETSGGEENQDPEEDDTSGIDPEMQEYIKEAQDALREIAGQESVMALIYLCDDYGVKKTPGMDSEEVVRVPSGATALIKGVEVDQDYNIWYQISVEQNGTTYMGYVDRTYLAYSNEVFTEWENTYFPQIATYASFGSGYPDIEQFPASYENKLMQLKQKHPNWIFVRQNTGLDWKKVVDNENREERSLISAKTEAAYRVDYHSPGWYYASEAAIEYYLDPRNFLDETRIFQFEQLTYNPSYHSKAAVQNILNNTFMKGALPGAGMTYADAFFQTGVALRVSPFHLACRVYQEQGEGKSPLISGNYDTVPAYVGYYNYFNIGASGNTTKAVVESGLARAVKEGWNSPYASIKGGSAILSKNYILRGQDTLYLQKFDVDASDGTLYTHQYMQNIMAPYSESQMVKTAYSKVSALDNPFVFKIPVYLNMPETACPVPSQVVKPTAKPTAVPTLKPTAVPTAKPTAAPTAKPTPKPTAKPTAKPTPKPTAVPTAKPTAKPTTVPTPKPTAVPTLKPTAVPTAKPTAKPTAVPTAVPTPKPTAMPTTKPTEKPEEETGMPTTEPALSPTSKPTEKPVATPKPTAVPTAVPTPKPTVVPTAVPTPKPTAVPTLKPTAMPTAAPTPKPTAVPTAVPTAAPTAAPVAENQPEQENNSAATSAVQNTEAAVASIAPTAPVSNEASLANGVPSNGTATAPVNVQENTNSSRVTIAAATPEPQTAGENEDAVLMTISDTGTVYGETLKKIKEKGTEVVLEMNDKVSWTIDGSTIESDNPEDVDLGVKLGSSRIPRRLLSAFVQDEKYVEMSLNYDGTFGFTAHLSLQLDQALPGQYANLFYYNEEEMTFEFMCASLVSSTSQVNYEFKHASDYVIIISDNTRENLLAERTQELEEAKEALNATEELPAEEPSKAAGIIALILLGSIALGIGAYLIMKK